MKCYNKMTPQKYNFHVFTSVGYLHVVISS